MTDLGPWSACDPAALDRVFDLAEFEAQVRALLDLAPKASAAELAALPWSERHKKSEFTYIRDTWAAERAAAREAERAYEEKPLDKELEERFEAAVRSGDVRGAKECKALLDEIAGSKLARSTQKEDDYSRLSDVRLLALSALVHVMRDEPCTEAETRVLAHLDRIVPEG